MPKKPDAKLSWEPSQGGSMGPCLILKLGNEPIGHLYVDTSIQNYRTILQQMVEDFNRS